MAAKLGYRKEKSKIITCLLPKGKGREVLRSLKTDRGVVTANLNHARGSGMFTALGRWGIGQQTEKDVIEVIVPDKNSNEVFEYLYERAGINQPHGGFMYMYSLDFSIPFRLPDIPEEN